MRPLQPRTLSNSELIRIAADELAVLDNMPREWQLELLRRFMALAPTDEYPLKDPQQLDLFK
jgi:hypothetical protein